MKIIPVTLILILIKFKIISSKIEAFNDIFYKRNIFIRDAITCIEANVIHIYFKENQPSCCSILSMLSESTPLLIRTFDYNVTKFELRKPVSIQLFLVESASNERVYEVLSLINRRVEHKHNLKYFIIFENLIDEEDEKWMKNMFNLFYNKGILNVVAIFFNGKMNAFTYSPYNFNGFLIVNLNDKICKDYFYEKLLNLHGQKIKISMIPENIKTRIDGKGNYIGADGILATTIIQR